MSRFLPLVMVKRALQNVPIEMPPETLKKMPLAIAKGLERLYNFQHESGGWGWFKGGGDDRMTVYVLYGLVRCKNTGTKVDADVLNRGLDWLSRRVANGAVAKAHLPGAHLVLALADRADKVALRKYAQELLQGRATLSVAKIALACRAAGLFEVGEKLAAKMRGWLAHSTEDYAMKLNVQVAFGAPLSQALIGP